MNVFPRSRGHIWGMIHVAALPGTPRNHLNRQTILDRARNEAQIYAQKGLDGIILENMHDLPYIQPQGHLTRTDRLHGNMSEEGKRYLFWCSNELTQFRIPEFHALAELFHIDLKWVDQNEKVPWIILDLDSETQALQILSRSLSVKYCIHLWGSGNGVEQMHEAVKAFPSEFKEPYFRETISFKVYVEAFMKKLTMAQRVQRIETFDYLPIKGPIRMKDPDVIFSYFEFYGDDQNRLDEHPRQAFFGRFIGEGQRHLMSKLSIKTRKFIGNTTMDPLLSLFMANLSLIRPNDLVLDPFVGTGSIPVAAAQFGAFIFGSDIDYLVVHAKTRPSRWKQKARDQDESMKANFQQYGLAAQYLDVVVADSSRPVWARKSILNAIVTDPPYGIRETILKVGTEKKNLVIPEEYLDTHYPQKVEYGISEVFYDLLNFGADSLCEKGRLAFWLPVNREEYSEKLLPRHPNLVLKFNVEQVLSSHTSRRLLVMEKVTTEEGAKAIPHEAIPDFRDNIQSAYALDKKTRKERIKKFGHLNLNDKSLNDNKNTDT